jgi:ubiquinone/menaquinone biosynthesis C-methylase UbiE
MWKSVNDIEEAKRIICNPTYKNTGEFLPDYEVIDQVTIEGSRVLDFGCGIGRNAKYLLSKEPYSLICYDYPNMIKMAKEYIGESNIRYIDYPIENLGEVKVVDFILANIVLQHIPVKELRESVLPEFKRLLGEEGRLLICSRGFTDDDNNIWKVLAEFFEPITKIDKEADNNTHQIGIYRRL